MTDDSGVAVRAYGLGKRFGATEALRGIDLAVPTGSVQGLLGPNGAGKTTLVRILATLLKPDAGTARVVGHDVVRDAARVRYRIGLAGQYAAVDEKLTGRANLRMFARLYHLPGRLARARADELLERFGLSAAGERLVRTYSGGMRRRLDLAASLLIEPAVLFLDEPTTGLDPRSRGEVWEAVRALVRGGTTVLLTTQYLDEADQLADRIAVIDHGRLIAQGSPADLKDRVGGARLEVVVAQADALDTAAEAVARSVARSAESLVDKGLEAPATAAATGPTTETDAARRLVGADIVAGSGSDALVAAVRELDAAGVAIDDIALRRPTLDDVFLRLTGHAADGAGDPGDGDGPEGQQGKGIDRNERVEAAA